MPLEPLAIDPATIVGTINRHDWPGFVARCHFDARYEDYGQGIKAESAPVLIEKLQRWVQSFSDLSIELARSIEQKNGAACEVILRGTHTGALPVVDGVIPPTSRPMVIPAVMLIGSDGEKIQTIDLYYDMVTLLDQLAVVE